MSTTARDVTNALLGPRTRNGYVVPDNPSVTTHTVTRMDARQCAYVVGVNARQGFRAEVVDRYVSDLRELMGEPIDDRSEALNGGTRGRRQQAVRELYGRRTTSTTTVGVGPLGTFGAFLGTHTVTVTTADRTYGLDYWADRTATEHGTQHGPQRPVVVVVSGDRTEIAPNTLGTAPARTRQQAQRVATAAAARSGRSGRKATCECGTCRKCVERVKRAERRARAKDATSGRAIATTY